MPLPIDARFSAPLWRSDSDGAWHFVRVPGGLSDEIRSRVEPGPGFGSVAVTVTIGSTTWSTSVFPDARSGCYLLPIKAAVRRAERLDDGDETDIHLITRTDGRPQLQP